ncbi:MAG: pseudouridine synthase [Bacteroidetes bacterium]|jgi:23S rRNA pseudouridine2605 synthase|nr:pseudouridine synthase [Bacteroidota bacterium]
MNREGYRNERKKTSKSFDKKNPASRKNVKRSFRDDENSHEKDRYSEKKTSKSFDKKNPASRKNVKRSFRDDENSHEKDRFSEKKTYKSFDKKNPDSRKNVKRSFRDDENSHEKDRFSEKKTYRNFDKKNPGSRKNVKRSFRDDENSYEKDRYSEKKTQKPPYEKRGNFQKARFSKQEFRSDKQSVEDEKVRLNKFIADSGKCSRREADKYIAAGLVSVNGKTVSELGFKIFLDDKVEFNGKLLSSEKKIYLVLNKPKDYVTSVSDPHADRTVMDLVKNACKERIYPVGRLDKMTSGILLFTNDGDLTKKLTHPKYNKKKIYHLLLNKPLVKNDMSKISEGFELEDGFVNCDAISYVEADNKKQIGIEIHSGRNRIVRRIFEHLGYRIIKLDRVYFAGLTKKKITRGRWRFLTEKEISLLKRGAYE